MRENTYWPDLCLIQVASSEEAAAIDPKGDLDMKPLLDLFVNNEEVLKVFHAGGQDLEIIHNLTGKVPHPLFDTQIAAMALGHGEQIGYSNLIESLLGHSLDRRRHPPGDDLPAHGREAEKDRSRRLARRGNGTPGGCV
jgi:ribonuclease D